MNPIRCHSCSQGFTTPHILGTIWEHVQEGLTIRDRNSEKMLQCIWLFPNRAGYPQAIIRHKSVSSSGAGLNNHCASSAFIRKDDRACVGTGDGFFV